MADVGDAALRLLDPRWSTIVGTVRQWTDMTGVASIRGPRGGPIGGRSRAVFGAAEPGQVPPSEVERFARVWRTRDGRHRVEQVEDLDGDATFTSLDDGTTQVYVHADGTARRLSDESNVVFATAPTWTGEPGLLLGVLSVELTGATTHLGRPVVTGTTTPVLSALEMTRRFGPMLGGFVVGTSGRVVVDAATGLVLRYEAVAEDGAAISIAEFLSIAVDVPIADGLFMFELGPGRRFRTHEDDMLDALAAQGMDVADIDRDDPAAVRRAMEEFHGGRHGGPPAHGGFPTPPTPQRLAELVAPLGPPPADVEAARAAIEEAVAGLSSDSGRPAADCIERGELVDQQPDQPPHPIVGDQVVTFSLSDVAFLREDEAVIGFEIRLSGGMGPVPNRGRAVRRGDRWLVSYDTWANLQQMGGQSVPSLLDHPEEGP